MLQWRNKNLNKFQRIAASALFLFAVIFCLGLFLAPVHAQGVTNNIVEGLEVIQEPLGLPATDIRIIIANIIRVALALLGVILVILFIYAGYLYMTAGGNDEQIGKSKSILKNATIGLIIVMSAYIIVLFVMKILGLGPGGEATPVPEVPPNFGNISGSGALGRLIKEHYPRRDQRDVPRNTMISITFFRPIVVDKFSDSLIPTERNPDGLVINSNNNGILGDCVSVNGVDTCDQLNMKPDIIDIQRVTLDANGSPTCGGSGQPGCVSIKDTGATLLVSANSKQQVDTLLIRPNQYLGAESENVTYVVFVGSGIKWNDPENGNPSIFDGFSESQYYWNFTCNTQIDLSPPYIIDTFPNKEPATKDSGVQVIFSEPVNPIGLQGELTAPAEKNYYQLPNGFLYLQSQASSLPLGSWRLIGNYSVLEFQSTFSCGVLNACGKPKYCLPLCDNGTCDVVAIEDGKSIKGDRYTIMLRAATTENDNSFTARFPFTGITDMAGNALNGNQTDDLQDFGQPHVNKVDPTVAVFNGLLVPDNYFWTFAVMDKIDTSSPYMRQIIPGLDAEDVAANQPWVMKFSKRMALNPIYDIKISEFPNADARCAWLNMNPCNKAELWKLPLEPKFAGLNNSEIFGTSTIEFAHGPFLKLIREYYFPELTSAVVDMVGNCFYPGLGPGDDTEVARHHTTSTVCAGAGAPDCCKVDMEINKSFCCNGRADGNVTNPMNADVCKTDIMNETWSPYR